MYRFFIVRVKKYEGIRVLKRGQVTRWAVNEIHVFRYEYGCKRVLVFLKSWSTKCFDLINEYLYKRYVKKY